MNGSQVAAVAAWVLRSGRRIAVTLIGVGLLLAGLAMLVMPGPGILVVIAGLAVLGTEYAWARRALREAKQRAEGAAKRVRRRRSDPPDGS